jgi:hypothetical protein
MDYSALRDTFKRDAWTESQERVSLVAAELAGRIA